MRYNVVKGIGLIEVVIGAAIITGLISAVVTATNIFLVSSSSQVSKVKAAYLAEEGIEAVKSIRDYSWTSRIAPLTVGSSYYLSLSTSSPYTWGVTTTPQYIDGMLRTVVLANAYRDANSDLVASGTNDTQSRLLTVTIAWPTRTGTTTYSLSTYITNLFSS
jgi:hypothetical protein